MMKGMKSRKTKNSSTFSINSELNQSNLSPPDRVFSAPSSPVRVSIAREAETDIQGKTILTSTLLQKFGKI
jgi:hypothetical protein